MSDRKVHFSVPIHQIEYLDKQWETASRLARDGSDWLRMGLDRQRFRDRIERSAQILDRILDFDYRQQIYQKRFENFVIPEQQATRANTTTTTTTTKQTIEPETIGAPQQQQQSLSQQRPQNQQDKGRRRRKRNNSRRNHRRARKRN